MQNNFEFHRLKSDSEISDFYNVLCNNLERHSTKPVHTLNELLDFKNDRLKDIVDFYGVYYNKKLIAGTMLFKFKDVLHTQYLAQNQNEEYSKLYAMDFLFVNTMQLALNLNFSKLSFGISTEDSGKILNKGLALFKEGFGSKYSVNKSYFKNF